MTLHSRYLLSMRARRAAVLALVCASGALAAAACRRSAPPSAPVAPVQPVRSLATQVSVTPVEVGPISDTADVTGALNSRNDVTVGIKVAGKIVAVYPREGDVVKQGQVVADQDPTDLRNQLDQQIANLAAAQSKLDSARAAYQSAATTLAWTNDQTASAIKQEQAALEAAREEAQVVRQGARPQERQEAQETVVAAKADLDKARSDLKRYEDLYRQEAVSAQELDQAQSIADSAQARYNSAVQALSLVREGSRPEDIRRAQDAVDQANSALAAAQSNRDQVAMRRADVASARAGILSAEAGVSQSQAAVRLAQQALRDARIRSPINGVVAERKVEPGMQLAITKPDVMRIVQLDDIYFDAQLSETQYELAQIHEPVRIRVDALPGKTFSGTVTSIYPVAASGSRTFTVRISIRNEGKLLRPQMFARGTIVLSTHSDALLVPRDAVLDNNGKTGRVFIDANGIAEERTVRLGFANYRRVEVTSGLRHGDLVITTGQAELEDGDRIQTSGGSAGQQTSIGALDRP